MVSSSLKVLLCLAAGAASEDVRRLNGAPIGLPAACLTACPSAQGWSDSILSLMTPPQGGQLDMGAAIGGIFGGLCSVPAEAFTCIANNANVCVIPGSDTVGTPSPAQYASMVGCLCNSCPGAGLAIGGFFGEVLNQLMAAFQNIGAAMGGQQQQQPNPEAEQRMMQAMCPMVGAMSCLSDNPATCAESLGLVNGMQFTGPALDSDNATAACEALGIPMTMPTTTNTTSTTSAVTASAASLVPGAGAAAALLAMLL